MFGHVNIKLRDIADVGVGTKPNDISFEKTAYEYINAGTTNSGYANSWNCDGDTVTTPSRGQGGIGYVDYQKNKFWLGPLCYKIKSNNSDILTKYLFYVISNSPDKILSLKKEGGIPAVNRSDLIDLEFAIPSLEEQNRIVSILDRFDTLCNDLTNGLPAEIEVRNKQYEYYRDKLLNFDIK